MCCCLTVLMGLGVEHKKDPGIPNSLPFKEDILAEIEMGRRQASTAQTATLSYP